MNLQVGTDRPDQPGQPQILNDHRIDARHDQLANRGLDVGQLVRKHQGIERDISPDAPTMQERHDLGQVGPVEVHRSDAGIVPAKTEIDGISAIFDGSQKTRPISCWRQKLRLQAEFRRKRRFGR